MNNYWYLTRFDYIANGKAYVFIHTFFWCRLLTWYTESFIISSIIYHFRNLYHDREALIMICHTTENIKMKYISFVELHQ